MLLLKITGLLTVFSVCTLLGLLKSVKLKKRWYQLNEIIFSLNDLKERIRLKRGEIEQITSESFSQEILTLKNSVLNINAEYLEKEDCELLLEFFGGIGMADITAECDRTELYIDLFSKKHSLAEKKCDELCKLYSTLGALIGCFICIFLI